MMTAPAEESYGDRQPHQQEATTSDGDNQTEPTDAPLNKVHGGNGDVEERQRLEEWRRKREARQKNRRQGNNKSSALAIVDEDAEEMPRERLPKERDNEDGDDTEILTAAVKRRKLLEQEVLLRADSSKGTILNSRRRQQALLREMRMQPDSHSGADPSTTESHDSGTNQPTEQSDGGKFEMQRDTQRQSSTTSSLSLIEQAELLKQKNQQQSNDSSLPKEPTSVLTAQDRQVLQRQEEEARLLKEASQVQTNALQAAQEVASGIQYTKPMPSTWTVPRYILQQGPQAWEQIRKEWHMEVEGHDVPPPLKRFVDMKLPQPIIQHLQNVKNIQRPTPIQMQGLPVALAGRDMVGIAFTGSGKTLTFALPLVMLALEEELRMPLVAGEGPIGLILAPSRELARQTFELLQELCQALSKSPLSSDTENSRPHSSGSNAPPSVNLTAQLMIGGENVRDQLQILQSRGLHCLVGTPGRVRDVLKRKAMTLKICRYICFDEADRMLDLGFDQEVGEIMNYFPHQRQTLLFSATFPKKFQDFARLCLVQPIVVNVGRAGAANLDVIQEVEYVKEEAKIVYLLHCLQKTAPPVIIFCERKGSADDIHEYLLLKGVEAVSIHGGKDQEERNEAIRLFKQGEKDVLIATDVAAKGLDFPEIQHVINFDMPSEIENYVHRIGRTGRCGKTGVATTFINKSCDETTLLDLKALLKEARQRIPPVLMMLDDPREKNDGLGCSFCGGLGHTIVDCPKIDKDARRVAGSHRDVISGGGDW